MARRSSVHAFGRLRRLAGGARGLGLGLGILCLLSGSAACAPIKPYNPDHLPIAQMDRIGEVCRNTMGISGGTNSEYMACEQSLSRSYAARLEAGAAVAVRRSCEEQGLKPGTIELSKCELHGPSAQLAQAAYNQDVDPPAAGPTKSYINASSDEVHHRMKEACADIGYDPVSSGFGQCVADLQSNLFDADNSAH
jgi:hypothetical protein